MTTKQTITRALKRAVKSGYEPVPGAKVVTLSVTLQNNTASYIDFQVQTADGRTLQLLVGLNDVLFDHRFAKALWGDDYHKFNPTDFCKRCQCPGDDHFPAYCYLWHLHHLALLDTVKGRISYIGSTM